MFERVRSCPDHPSEWEVKVTFHQMGQAKYHVECTHEGCARKEIFDTSDGVDPRVGVIGALRLGQNYTDYSKA